jgi:monoamine oxidase
MSVVVVGAGLAGLTAATELLARGADVIVLEARGRAAGAPTASRSRPGSGPTAVPHTSATGTPNSRP